MFGFGSGQILLVRDEIGTNKGNARDVLPQRISARIIVVRIQWPQNGYCTIGAQIGNVMNQWKGMFKMHLR